MLYCYNKEQTGKCIIYESTGYAEWISCVMGVLKCVVYCYLSCRVVVLCFFFVDKIGLRYFSLYPVTSYGKITISLCKLEVKGKRFSL